MYYFASRIVCLISQKGGEIDDSIVCGAHMSASNLLFIQLGNVLTICSLCEPRNAPIPGDFSQWLGTTNPAQRLTSTKCSSRSWSNITSYLHR